MQIVTAIQSLRLDVFPFEAFDEMGRLRTDLNVDERLKQELAAATGTQEWRSLCTRLALLDNPGHESTALGVKVHPDGARLMAFRPVNATWLGNPTMYGRWHASLHANILQAIQQDLPRRPWVQPSWIDAIRKILDLLRGKGGDDGKGGGNHANLSLIEAPDDEAALAGWNQIVAAIDLILGFLEIGNSIGRSARVQCSVVWQYTGFPSPPLDWSKYSTIGPVVHADGRSVSGVFWDRKAHKVWDWTKSHPWPTDFFVDSRRIGLALHPSGLLGEGGT